MKSFINKFKDLYNYRDVFIYTGAWGLLAHAVTFFNKFSTHDDLGRFNLGATYMSGRWMLAKLETADKILFGGSFSTPWFNGFVSLMLISLALVLIFDMLEMNSKLMRFCLCGAAATFPAITCLFGFIFTAPAYMIGLLVTVAAVWIIHNSSHWAAIVVGAVMFACSIGIYQAFISVFLSLCLLSFIKKVADGEKLSGMQALKIAVPYFICALAGLALYLAVNSIEIGRHEIEMTSYSGLNNFGMTSVEGYFQRMQLSWDEFFCPDLSACNYPMAAWYMYRICVIVMCAYTIVVSVLMFKENKVRALFFLAAACAFPVLVNFIYVMESYEYVYELPLIGQFVTFIFAGWLVQRFKPDWKNAKEILHIGFCALMCFSCIIFSKHANICYLKAELVQEETRSYLTTLVTRIKSCPEYDDEMPVMLYGQIFEDSTLASIPELDIVPTWPYGMFGTNVGIEKKLKFWCDFEPDILDAVDYIENAAVAAMPFYPDDGSIKVVDGVVCVKISDTVDTGTFYSEIKSQMDEN